ncbi:MAG: hypothetical protein R3324_07565, partial [Halobacteriales archaeon]|nr:hypothetical protein [Halobacteriales archaeon]
MANRITDVSNNFSTELSLDVSSASLTFPVLTRGGITSPCYITIAPDDDAKREVIYCDGTFGASSFVTSDVLNRGLQGSAGGAQSHVAGTPVSITPLAQHIDDLNDRVTGHQHGGGTDGAAVDHGALSGRGDDDHTIYPLVTGNRGFTGPVGGVTPTSDAHLATKQYVDTAAAYGGLRQ